MKKETADIYDFDVMRLGRDFHLTGQIRGHSRQNEFKESRQMTSAVIDIDFDAGVAETRNTIYRLHINSFNAVKGD